MPSDKPVVHGGRKVWSLARQILFVSDFPTFSGAALDLMFANVTDTCTMAFILAKMPWNKSSCDK